MDVIPIRTPRLVATSQIDLQLLFAPQIFSMHAEMNRMKCLGIRGIYVVVVGGCLDNLRLRASEQEGRESERNTTKTENGKIGQNFNFSIFKLEWKCIGCVRWFL